MATVEIEVWTQGAENDYARLLTELDDEVALNLYRHLNEESYEWCESSGVSPQVYRRTTGRHVTLGDILSWYKQEDMLKEVEIGGETAFIPVPDVQKSLQKSASASSLVPVDNE